MLHLSLCPQKFHRKAFWKFWKIVTPLGNSKIKSMTHENWTKKTHQAISPKPQLRSSHDIKLHFVNPKKNKKKTGGIKDILFFKSPLELLILLYPYKLRRKQAFIPGNSVKLFDTPWKFQGQKPRLMIFSQTPPGNSTCFLIDHWNLDMLFLHTLRYSMSSTTPSVWTFLEQPIQGTWAQKMYQAISPEPQLQYSRT